MQPRRDCAAAFFFRFFVNIVLLFRFALKNVNEKLSFQKFFLSSQTSEGNGLCRGTTRERMTEGAAVLLERMQVITSFAFFLYQSIFDSLL